MRSVVLVCLVACSSPHASDPDATTSDAQAGDAVVRGTPQLVSSDEICKLLNNRNISDPTANDVQHRSNVLGADLGIPVDANGQLYIFFGDTIGFAGIWGGGQSHPDAVGYATDATPAVIADPTLLCHDLRIVSLPASASVGPQVDSSVQADFAAGSMTAPGGHTLAEYIHNPSGPPDHTFPNLPGDFEVPSGAFAVGGAIYVLYTTVASASDVTMKASYLAKWAAPATTSIPAYDIQYAIDERFDDSGPLHGNFVNIAAEVAGDDVYLFGTGAYRASSVHLAKKPVASLDQPGGFEDLGMLFGPEGYGETSVRYFPEIDRWMFLAEELLPTSNRIVARFADHAEGPWSEPIVVHDMADPQFQSAYCCAVDDQCDGKQMFNCDRTGFYGSYLLPGVQVHADGSFTVLYTLSSFDPYDVAVFATTFTAG
jgi:hypothetical protein